MLARTLTLALLASAALAAHASPPPQPVVRTGSCPSGYYSSGNYCVPGNNARFALPRSGSCPSGYYSSGDYCVASSESSRLAIPRAGSCPSGYYSSGDYCVSSR
ncbi:MAG: hypothetical protein RIS35_1073 [Pseudomonadota bacterium]